MKNSTKLGLLAGVMAGVLPLSLLPVMACPPTTNLGPNSSVFSPPPLNPQTQSIHPSK